jgi:hypothetical protein
MMGATITSPQCEHCAGAANARRLVSLAVLIWRCMV